MNLVVRCPTAHAMFLPRILTSGRIFRFPVEEQNFGFPGWRFTPRPLVSVHEEIGRLVFNKTRRPGQESQLQIEAAFSEPIDSSTTLYLGSLNFGELEPPFATLPFREMMLGMPRDRRRLVFLKAIQMMTGSHLENIKVVETNDIEKLLN